jgi:hypothetical protein
MTSKDKVNLAMAWYDSGLEDRAAFQTLMESILAQPEQEPVAHDKTEINFFVQDLYDKKMQEGKHGHYETMFHVVHQAIKRATPPQRTWVGLTNNELQPIADEYRILFGSWVEDFARAIEAKLKEKNNAA